MTTKAVAIIASALALFAVVAHKLDKQSPHSVESILGQQN